MNTLLISLASGSFATLVQYSFDAYCGRGYWHKLNIILGVATALGDYFILKGLN